MKKFSLLLISFIFAIIQGFGQVDLQIILRNPVPSELSVWANDPTIFQVIVTNTGTNDYSNATLAFRITDSNDRVIAEAQYGNLYNRKLWIPASPAVSVFNGQQLININAVNYNKDLEALALTTNSLPEGDYQICLSMYDETGQNITRNEEYCAGFSILWPEPPMLITPTDDDELPSTYPTFVWTPVINYDPTSDIINYKIKICPMFEGQTVRSALEGNLPLLEKDALTTTSYLYLPTDPGFDLYPQVTRYVWMVQAFHSNGNPLNKNQGKSEAGTFRLPSPESEFYSLNNYFPANGDTIPWSTPHLVVKLDPCSDDIRSLSLSLSCKKDGDTQVLSQTRTLTFPNGIMSDQQLTDPEEAGLLVVNLDETKQFPGWISQLQPGALYRWNCSATLTKQDGSTQTLQTSETTFVYGLKHPAALFPKADTAIRANTPIEAGIVIGTPSKLNFSETDILSNPLHHAYQTQATTSASLLFEFSKRSTFDSICYSKNIVQPTGQACRTGSACDQLFKQFNQTLTAFSDTGTYFWRLSYLKQNSLPYWTSATRKITIVPDSLAGCFQMLVQQPANNGKWTTNKKPRFAVSTKPQIKKSAITGGRIRVWKMNSQTQTIANAKTTKAVLDTVFSGNADNKLFAYNTDTYGFTRYDLNFINGDTTSKAFTCDSASFYVWDFRLNYNKDSIRADKQVCDSSSLMSNDGIFQVVPTKQDKNRCPDECFVDAPSSQTAGTQSLKADSTIKVGKFDMKLITVSGTPAFLSGTGSIEVPYLRGYILVEFNGLKVNSSNEVYEGEIYAQIDEDAEYSKPEGNDFEGKAISFAHDKLKFKKIHEKSSSLGKLVSALAGKTNVTLPLGFDKDIDGYKMVLDIIGMRFTPTQATLNAVTYVTLPSLGPDVGLGFGMKNICFHPKGFAGMENAVLYLAQDFGYENEGTWSFLFKSPTPTDSGSYMTWDCEGFKEMVLAIDVAFPHSWLSPVNAQDPDTQVKAHMKGRAQKSGNGWQWLAGATLDECELAGADGYKMQVQDLIFDYSDAANPIGMTFPKNYEGDKSNSWKGFYIKRASVTLPDNFKTFDNENPAVSINHALINWDGFTGEIWGENVVQYPRANFGNWGAGIDSLKLRFLNGSVQSGSIKGRMKIPFIDSTFIFSGIVAETYQPPGSTAKKSINYLFSIAPKDTVGIGIWKSKLSLYPTSKIEYYDSTGSAVVRAILNGKLDMEGSAGKISQLGFKGITFERLKFFNSSPYCDIGDFNLASPQHSMSGFPVSIDHVGLVTGAREGGFGIGLKFNLNVGLQPGANAISGTTALSVWGKMILDEGPQHCVFDGVELDSIGVDADLSSVRIKGGLRLFDSHPAYGNGFKGAITATFIDQLTVGATAQFGSVNNYRYWYVDAKTIFDTGVPIFSGLDAYGFGGGAWYHMRQGGETDLSETTTEPDDGSVAGTSSSGFAYTPDKTVEQGLQASLIIGTHPSPEAFNGDVGLNVQFLSNGGIGTISMVGDGFLLCSINNQDKAKVEAKLNLTYDLPERTFHGVANVDINASPFDGGGQMVLHFDPDRWYIKIGEPEHPMRLTLADWLSADSYFMTGQELPAPPPLPAEVLALFPSHSNQRSFNTDGGNGFAFGASSHFDTGRKQYLIFYGDISAIFGFDMALLNFGNGVNCSGQSEPIGINGWYAMGQVYAAVSASIGLYVDLWFTSGYYEILSLQLGSILQGAGPNPLWMKGAVTGNYRILKGAVKGHCDFYYTMGEPCEIISENPLVNVDLISDINPADGQTQVDVFTEPMITTGFEINTPFDITQMASTGDGKIVRTFRIKLNEFSLKKITSNDSIAGQANISPDSYSMYYSPHEMMNGNSRYRFSASAYGEEYLDGQWIPAKKNNGTIIRQTVRSVFKTGSAPLTIPDQNVAYSYPINNQDYFLQDECRAGKIQLKSGQDILFQPREGFSLELIARFIPKNEGLPTTEVPFTYNSASRSVRFDIPPLINNQSYQLLILKKESCNDPQMAQLQQLIGDLQSGSLLPNIGQTEENRFSSGLSTVLINRRTISSSRIKQGERLLYSCSFKTSRFNTLQAKMDTYNQTDIESEFGQNDQEWHTATFKGAEFFDRYDFSPVVWYTSGTRHQFGPLIGINGSLRNTPWHTQFTNSQVYNEIEWMKSKQFWQGPVKYEQSLANTGTALIEVEFNQYKPSISEMANLFGNGSGGSGQGSSSGNTSSVMPGLTGIGNSALSNSTLQNLSGNNQESPEIRLSYNHGLIISSDYHKLNNRALSILSGSSSILLSQSAKNRLHTILQRPYQPMYKGSYPILFYYNYSGCTDPDSSIPVLSKSLIY